MDQLKNIFAISLCGLFSGLRHTRPRPALSEAVGRWSSAQSFQSLGGLCRPPPTSGCTPHRAAPTSQLMDVRQEQLPSLGTPLFTCPPYKPTPLGQPRPQPEAGGGGKPHRCALLSPPAHGHSFLTSALGPEIWQSSGHQAGGKQVAAEGAFASLLQARLKDLGCEPSRRHLLSLRRGRVWLCGPRRRHPRAPGHPEQGRAVREALFRGPAPQSWPHSPQGGLSP